MKTITILSVLTLILLSAACKKITTSATVIQQISLKADGVLFSVTTGDAGVTQSDAHTLGGTKFQLDATTSTKDFSINNQTVPSTGTYNMNGAGTVFNFVQWEDGSELFSSLGTSKSHFTFNISQIAGSTSDYKRYVEGTFSGVIYNSTQTDSVKITEGQINIVE